MTITNVILDGRVVGFEVGWGADRKFATDMAGFAVNLDYFKDHKGINVFYDVLQLNFGLVT